MIPKEKLLLLFKTWTSEITIDNLLGDFSSPVFLGETNDIKNLFRNRIGILSPQVWSSNLVQDFLHRDRTRIRYGQYQDGRQGYIGYPKII